VIDILIDFCIYTALTVWAVVKCAFLGGVLVSPFVVWAMCVSGKRADEMMERHAQGRQERCR
jgi:hypothetical protein